jgi:hypothetical protein
MGVKRAMVIFENRSNLPEARIVNTFHFSSDTLAIDIPVPLEQFYNPSTGTKPGSYINDRILRTAGKSTIRVYDLADAMPREAQVFSLTLPAAGGSVNLPNEVAACCSFYADRNLKRQRGRIYLGPLHTGAIEADAAGPDMRLNAGLIDALADVSLALSGNSTVNWCVWSEADGVARPVTNGWVDNAVDIQRRRGAKSTARQVWGS